MMTIYKTKNLSWICMKVAKKALNVPGMVIECVNNVDYEDLIGIGEKVAVKKSTYEQSTIRVGVKDIGMFPTRFRKAYRE